MTVPPAEIWDLRFGAMGTRAHLLVEGEPELLAPACRQIERLERLWSRFLEDSEVSRLNRAGGATVPVEPETAELLARGAEGWRMTGGLFDPTLLNEVIAAGYDRDFEEIEATGGGPAPASPPRRPGGEGLPLSVDPQTGTASVDPAVGFDSGGIGKGLGADLVAERLRDGGATRALVSLGGDLRALGGPAGRPWRVSVDNPFDPKGRPAARLQVADRGLATSTSLARRWQQGGEERHHLIDPRTGRPAAARLASATAIAARGWQAEALAKAAFLSSPERALRLLAENDATGLVIDLDGRIRPAPGLEPFLLTPPRELAAARLRERALAQRGRLRLPGSA
ncbi:MAG: FAD:protein FMN transferase [Solirubrobacterales bacterium]